jgi:hypothetical protein
MSMFYSKIEFDNNIDELFENHMGMDEGNQRKWRDIILKPLFPLPLFLYLIFTF